MYCGCCGCVVCHKEKSTVEGAPVPTRSSIQPLVQQTDVTKTPTKQLDLQKVLSGLNENQSVCDDFVAAFLQAGILPAKLEHPSIQGLLRKCTKVAGCLPLKSAMYNAARRVGTIHLGAIRKIARGKKVWVGTDEWTSDQGHAIIDVLLGVHGKIFVVSTLQLQCKGPNLGVEHSELGSEVVSTLSNIGVDFKDVIAFVSDFAAVLKKAFTEVLQPICPNARWVPCASHMLNNIAKLIL